MMRIDVSRIPSSAALRLCVMAGFLAASGCSDPTPTDKREDPSLKASMEKSLEIYKSKTPTKKGSPAPAVKGPS